MSYRTSMKIISMACLPLDIELACFGTLSKYVREKHEGHIVISKNKMDWPKKLRELKENHLKISAFLKFTSYQNLIIQRNPRNVNSLSSIVRTVNPPW